MTTGIIDVGSNTIRLSIYKYYEDGSFRQLINKKAIVGLAAFVVGGRLSPKGVSKLIKTLSLFGHILEELEVTEIHAFATAALRSAANSPEVMAQVYEETGIPMELIGGEEEARLSFIGAKSATDISDGMVADIGGASCEIIAVSGGKETAMHSLPIGCLSLGLGNIAGVTATKKEVQHMRTVVRSQLSEVSNLFRHIPKQLCFVGGSARSVYRTARELYDIRERILTSVALSKVEEGLENRDVDIYHALRSAAPERFFTLLPGAIIMQEIAAKCQADRMAISKCGIREGYLLDRIIKKLR